MDTGKSHTPPEQIEKRNNNQPWWQPALMLFSRMSAWVIAPVVLALFLGKWLDKILDSEPWGLISIVGLSFVVSMVGLVNEASREYTKIEKTQNLVKKK